MPIRDKGTGTEDNNICFSNKPVTMRIWRRSSRPHGGPDAAPQLQKQLALHHFSEIISRSAAPAVCCILTRGAIAALHRVSPALCLLFISVMGWAPASRGTWKPRVLQSRCCLLKAGTKVRMRDHTTGPGGKSTNPSLATGSVTLQG